MSTALSFSVNVQDLLAQYSPQDPSALAKYHLEHCKQDIESNNLQGAILHCQSAVQYIKRVYGPYTTNQTLSNDTRSSSIVAQASESGVTAIPVVLKELCALESRIIYNQTRSTIDLSHSSVLAQDTTSTLDSTPIIPAPETSSGDDDDSSNENSDNGDGESSSSPGSAVDDINPQDDTSSSEEEETDELEDDYVMTNPLREQIRERVMGAFNVSEIAFP